MKKSLYFAMAVAALAFTACDDESYNDWAQPNNITSEQGTVDDVTVTVTPASTIDFASAEELVSMFKVATSNGKVSSVIATINGNEIETDANGSVYADALENIFQQAYGRAPELRTLDAALAIQVDVNGNIYDFKQTAQVAAQMDAPFIESAYYLVGDMCGWSADSMIKLTHDDSQSVYDDPTFTVTFETTAANQYWKLIGQSGVDAGDIWSAAYGVEIDGDASPEGYIVSTNVGAGLIEEVGKYKLTINMLEGTYAIEEVKYDPFIYFIGATDGWAASDQKLALTDGDKGVYSGYIYVADPNGWGVAGKFQRVQGSWDNQINAGSFTTMEGCHGEDNIEFDAVGVYYIQVGLGEAWINATLVTTMGLIGNFNSWGGDVEMTWDAENYCYVATGLSLTEGWKFRVNGGWDINLGGHADGTDIADLTNGGNDITVVGSTVKLYPTRKDSDKIYCTVE